MTRYIFVLALAIAGCSATTADPEPTTPQAEAREERPRERRVARAEREAADEDRFVGGEVTAEDQSNEQDDLAITQRIRENVVGDNDLSFRSKNCTIVTQAGVVTLRGTVPNVAEREAIVAHVRLVDGVRRIDNQLEVNP